MVIFSDRLAHENIERMHQEILDRGVTDTRAKKLQYLVDSAHYHVDELENISSKLQNMMQVEDEKG